MSPKLLTCLAVMAGLIAPATALGGEGTAPRGVVELFTAQGCVSCPPADAVFEKLVRQGDVVALAYHVDYWNYLGWSDTLGTQENTQRQYGYAKSLGRSNVYTPQAIINGRDHVNGADLVGINARLDTFGNKGAGLTVPVSATLRNGELGIEIGGGQGKAEVVVAYFRRVQSVEVLKGQNKGRKATYWNSVYDVQTVGMWEGLPLRITLPTSVMKMKKGPGKDGCAVLLQTAKDDGAPAAIIGATILTP
ncbi:DUF1223 domain-containing protein [Rhizobiaceae bacterium BDR2-2]|uniref:DUF1223 domain-containing protein n=1 Tax=Ectorhizobium quercum TaxID=2965071 RepID=A0AAE3SX24_9HYPH|nr:DUF1223 domain-containing protein [Ectorhizobium quercum]MCX8999323.1 DUF1223 domain-containing protein [Ectorhizobium quercum]